MEEVDISRVMYKPYLMIAGIIGFVFSITFTLSGKFSEMFGTAAADSAGFDFGTNMGIALSIGFLLLFIASVVEITPKMIEKENY
jgi:hypothetical protein